MLCVCVCVNVAQVHIANIRRQLKSCWVYAVGVAYISWCLWTEIGTNSGLADVCVRVGIRHLYAKH